VQFKVLRPIRRDAFYWFDKLLFLEAKIAFYLKESLGTSTKVLALFAHALSNLKDEGCNKASIPVASVPANERPGAN
jgi:hypothetical protein